MWRTRTDHTHRSRADTSSDSGPKLVVVLGQRGLADSEAGTPAGPSGEPGLHETLLLIHPLLAVVTHGHRSRHRSGEPRSA